MEGREVKRYVPAEMFDEAGTHCFQFAIGVVEPWNQQCRDLEPDAGLMMHGLRHLKHGFKRAPADSAAELLRKAHEFYVGRVHMLGELRSRFRALVPGGQPH